nr:carbohydrate binding domain-containing protein [Lactiplantibacillus plantarum]
MADITHGTWIKDGKAVDAVYQSGIKVYGRNLYVDTENFDNSSVWNNWGIWSKTEEKLNDLTVMSTTGDWSGLGQTIQAKKGETYTFSIYARYQSGTGKSNMYFAPAGVTSTNPGTVQVSLNETWKLLIGTFTITNDGPIIARIERTNNNTNTLLIAGLKLERGTIATPHSIAPEDILN